MKKKLLFVAGTLCFISGFAQTFKLTSHAGISDQYNAVNAGEKIQFTPNAAKILFGLNANSDMVLQKIESDKLGYIHYRFHQTYQNIPIEKAMFIVHTKNGLLQSMSGNIITDFDPAMNKQANASVSADRAITLAVANVAAKIYAWQNAGMQKQIKIQTNNLKASYYPTAKLIFYNPQSTLMPRELKLCYKVNIYALTPLSNADYFIDAQTGKVLGKEDKINTSDATGTANTGWSGNQTIHSDMVSASNFRLRDYSRGSGVITLHGESGQRGNEYTSTSKNWSLGGTDQAAMDAHYGVEKTYSFYMANFGRNSYDGAGTALYSYVNDPTYTDNAFWDGSAMNYNKRTGSNFGVTGIDVTGHELTHGVTQTTSALNYSYESGAINESMSDIMGKSVQFWAKPGDVNWQLSNDMGWIIRDMSNPNLEGQPDTYLGTNWYTGSGDNGGVHYNSGVGNFMFYLLVAGGSGTNDNGASFSVAGIGLSEADQILYRSETVYLTSTSQYTNWRDACINGATDLYGSTSNEVIQVKNAFHAVGIGSDASGCDAPAGLAATNIGKKKADLSWTEVNGASNYTLQWKLITAKKFERIPNITTPYELTNLQPGYTYIFQVKSKCSGSVTSDFSVPYSFTTLPSGNIYCSSYGSTTYEYIDKVSVSNVAYTSGNNNGYGNFISLKAAVTAGVSYPIELTPGFTSGSYQEYWTAYADYNQDGDFTDAGELIGTVTSSTSPVTLNLNVPSSALNGTTRLRIQMNYSSYSTDPCSILSFGEVEDYSLKISGATFNSIASENDTEKGSVASITVMPNPVKSYSATAILNLIKQGNASLKITDLSGRLLIKKDVTNLHAGKNAVVLNGLNNLTNGIFMVVAEQNGIVVGRGQIVVDR